MNLIFQDAAKAAELGRDLRESSSEFMKKRRGVLGLSLASIASMGVIALYQTGILKHVPEPPLPGLDADKVNGSAQAGGAAIRGAHFGRGGLGPGFSLSPFVVEVARGSAFSGRCVTDEGSSAGTARLSLAVSSDYCFEATFLASWFVGSRSAAAMTEGRSAILGTR
jgi:hypothetical protein